jgi:tripartite-type tricarboxylate transporter receptor subunit TctC
VRLIVPFPPGGTTDLISRLLAQKFQEVAGQALVVENRPGAAGAVAIDLLMRSPADGYTLLLATSAHLAQNPHIYTDLRYSALTDFDPIAPLGITANVLAVAVGSPIRSLDDLVRESTRVAVTYGSPGAGTTAHLAVEMLAQKDRLKLVHAPYRGAGPALNDAVGGHLGFVSVSVPSAAPLIHGGKLRGIALTGLNRSPLVPGVPSIAEKIPDFNAVGWYSVVAPKGTDRVASVRLHEVISRITAMPDVRAAWAAQGIEVMNATQAEFAAFMRADYERWGPIIKRAGVKAE